MEGAASHSYLFLCNWIQLRTVHSIVRKRKLRASTYKEWVDLGKLGRENGIARTFENHRATLHKYCRIRQNQAKRDWIKV